MYFISYIIVFILTIILSIMTFIAVNEIYGVVVAFILTIFTFIGSRITLHHLLILFTPFENKIV